MKTLLAIIAAASLIVGCGVIEEEQTTTDSGGGVIATAAPIPTGSAVTHWSGTKQLGTSGDDFAIGITSDPSGNVYVTGYTGGGLDGNASAGDNDSFVAKYDSGGIKQWTRQIGTSNNDQAYDITSDPSGNIYVTGYTGGGLDGNASAGNDDIFIVKYDSGGIKQWTQQLGTAEDDIAIGITYDPSGNVYVTGHTSGGLDGNASAGYNDIFIVKYDSGGIKQWTQQLGTADFDRAFAITSDSSGNVYVTGYTQGSLDGNTNAGSEDLFVAKYDSGGIKQWTRQIGTAEEDIAIGITSDPSGNVYVTGYTGGSLDGYSNGENNDIFIVKYDSGGIKQWTQQLGSAEEDFGIGITLDSSGDVYATGFTGGGLDGNANAGNNDFFVVKYDTDGNKQ